MRARRSAPAILGAILAIGALALALRWMFRAPPHVIEPVAGAQRAEPPRVEPSAPATTTERPEAERPREPDPDASSAERVVDSGETIGFALVRREDGTPISDAVLGVPAEVALEQRTDAPGWRLDELAPLESTDPAGLVRLEASQADPVLLVRAPGFGAALVDRAWLRRDREQPLEILLAPAATLQASIHDPGGAPIEGVLVRAFTFAALTARCEAQSLGRLEDRFAVVQRITDGGGRATLELPPRVPFMVEVWHGGVRLASDSSSIQGDPGESFGRSWTVDRGQTIRGRALDEDGEPIAGAKLEVVAPANDPAALMPLLTDVTTDERGRFELALQPGTYVLRLEPQPSTLERDGFLLSLAGVVVTRDAATPSPEIAVRRGFTVRGLVLDADGAAVKSRIEVHRVGVGVMPFLGRTTDAEGRFVLGPFELDDTYELVAVSLDGSARSDEFVADRRRRDLVLRLRR